MHEIVKQDEIKISHKLNKISFLRIAQGNADGESVG